MNEPREARCALLRSSLPLAAWLLASATFPNVAVGDAAGRDEVRFEGDVVSVFALASPVDEILRSIGPAARFTISERCGPAGCAVVSGARRGALVEIMSWLLGRQNHLILHSEVAEDGASTGIARIVLLPSGSAKVVPDVGEGIAPPQVAPIATAEERRALRKLQAARLPRSGRQTALARSSSGTGAAIDAGEQTLAIRSSARDFERLSSPDSVHQISSGFGWRRDPFDGQLKHHDGVDLVVPGGTPLKSSRGGRVVFAGSAGRYGKTVEIDHGGEMRTRYAHLSQVLVEVGERVLPGQTIGYVGGTGRATGPHLHFEVRLHGQPQDPLSMAGVWPDLGLPVTRYPEAGG